MVCRGAVVGCGLISEFHLRGWRRVPGVEIVALVDPDRARANDRRDEFCPEARVYPDFAAARAAERLDFVEILTPPALHAAHCREAAAAGLHVICQKPLCENLAEARGLVADLGGDERLFCVHENHVYRPWFRQVLAAHREGRFGETRELRVEQYDPVHPPQRLNLEAERGVLLQYGTHLLDMIRHLLGIPEWVEAETARENPAVRAESLVEVALGYPGVAVSMGTSWGAGPKGRAGLRLRGEDGEALYEGTMIRGGSARLRIIRKGVVEVDEERSTVEDYVESFGAFQCDFAAALQGESAPPQPARENLRTLALVFAAYAAAERGERVAVAEFAAA